MKTRRTVYLIVGCLLLVLNLILDLVEFSEPRRSSGSTAYDIGYIIGSHIFAIAGLIFLRLAYNIHKKIKAQEEDPLDDIDDIGKNNTV